ncbi:hypothetical protein RHGRI_033532 [Rhododendron griersonianum]|uniref:Uncharacterized protein n=1 Tax=Rhododendron griersonianum TaxID=479676 RepID=A0AAV6I2P7_9ERIC|nr:hypothetical protein RHGRI_033532 [Rhododendron griersonianum]
MIRMIWVSLMLDPMKAYLLVIPHLARHIARVFNKRTLVVEESVHVAFDKTDHISSKYFPSIDNLDDEMPREISVRNEIHVEIAPNLVSASADNANGVAIELENGVSSTAAEHVNELISITP